MYLHKRFRNYRIIIKGSEGYAMRIRNKGFDLLKGFACICVILIHCPFPGKFGVLLRTISKFAVPFFFAISGYFGVKKWGVKRKIEHILTLCIAAELFYFVYDFLIEILLQNFEIREALVSVFNTSSLLRLLVFNAPLTRPHLWFLYALIYCYVTAFVIERLSKNVKIGIMLFGLVGFTMLSEVFPVMGIPNRIDICVQDKIVSSYAYNLYVFRALPFFIAGSMMREKWHDVMVSLSDKRLICGACTGLACSVFERLFFSESQFYLGTYLFVLCIFALCVKTKWDGRGKVGEIFTFIGKELSFYVYVLHIWCFEISGMIVSIFIDSEIAWNRITAVVLTVIMTLSLSYAIFLCKACRRKAKGIQV